MSVTKAARRDVTVLLLVYRGDRPEYLEESLRSIGRQTVPPGSIQVVVDGPIPGDLESVLQEGRRLARVPLHVQRLAKQSGQGVARQAGLRAIDTEYIAIQDADDISHPQRLERTLPLLDGGADIVGTALWEFEHDPWEPFNLRSYPEADAEIRRMMRWNSPFANPTAVYRVGLAKKVGGYRPELVSEDYDLWARMMASGGHGRNLQEPLVLFRADPGYWRRRGGVVPALAEYRQVQRLRRCGYVPVAMVPVVTAVRAGYRLAPVWVKKVIYGAALA